MSNRRIEYRSWALRVITWDAALPAVVALVPVAVRWIFPGWRGAMEITAVVLPVAAFLFRLRAGSRQIGSNRCSSAVRRVQMVVFCLAILPLALFECFLILFDLMPAGAGAIDRTDLIACLILLSIYLGGMIVAMYPGRAEQPS